MLKSKLRKLNHVKIKERRMDLNFNQEEMAKTLGMGNKSVYSRYENGQIRWRADQLPQLAEVLHVDIEYFFD